MIPPMVIVPTSVNTRQRNRVTCGEPRPGTGSLPMSGLRAARKKRPEGASPRNTLFSNRWTQRSPISMAKTNHLVKVALAHRVTFGLKVWSPPYSHHQISF